MADTTIQRYAAFYPVHPALLPNINFWSDRLAQVTREYSDRSKHYRLTTWIVPRLSSIGLSCTTAVELILNLAIDTVNTVWHGAYRVKRLEFSLILSLKNFHPRNLLRFQQKHFAFTNQGLARLWHQVGALNPLGLRSPTRFARLGLNPQQTFLRNQLLTLTPTTAEVDKQLDFLGREYGGAFRFGIIPALGALLEAKFPMNRLLTFLFATQPPPAQPPKDPFSQALSLLHAHHEKHPDFGNVFAEFVLAHAQLQAHGHSLNLAHFQNVCDTLKSITHAEALRHIVAHLWKTVGQLNDTSEKVAHALLLIYHHEAWRQASNAQMHVIPTLRILGQRLLLKNCPYELYAYWKLGQSSSADLKSLVSLFLRNGLLTQDWFQMVYRDPKGGAALRTACQTSLESFLSLSTAFTQLADLNFIGCLQEINQKVRALDRQEHPFADSYLQILQERVSYKLAATDFKPEVDDHSYGLQNLAAILETGYGTAIYQVDADAIWCTLLNMLPDSKTSGLHEVSEGIKVPLQRCFKAFAAKKTPKEYFAGYSTALRNKNLMNRLYSSCPLDIAAQVIERVLFLHNQNAGEPIINRELIADIATLVRGDILLTPRLGSPKVAKPLETMKTLKAALERLSHINLPEPELRPIHRLLDPNYQPPQAPVNVANPLLAPLANLWSLVSSP